jgi:uncharacterized protein (DUF1778 family)
MTPDAKRTLMHAAAVANKSLTDFLLDSGMNAAIDTLTGPRAMVLDDTQWQAFMAELGTPPADNPALHRLLARKPVWEE